MQSGLKSPDGLLELMVKILGMLGSAHDGEVLAAARRAEEQRLKLGSSWEQIICGHDADY